jgi:hypothetical protein
MKSGAARRRGRIRTVLTSRPGPRVFGVGAAKTGTHTLGEMFADQVASAHEADAEALIQLHLARETGGTGTRLRARLRARDWWRKLKVDASQVNIYLIDDLEALFRGNLYVLTVRPPVDWLRSMLDDTMRRDTSATWRRFRDYRFAGHPYAPGDEPLRERDLYPLAGYLGYWRDSIERVLNRVPRDRLIVVATHDLQTRREEIARACGIPLSPAPVAPVRAFANPQRFNVLGQMDPDRLAAAIENACGGLAARMFPEHSIAADVERVAAAARDPASGS